MKYSFVFEFLFLGILIGACGNFSNEEDQSQHNFSNNLNSQVEKTKLDKKFRSDSEYGYKAFIINPTVDSLYNLLTKDKNGYGKYYISDHLPLLFLVSGDIFKKGVSNAAIISSPNDSTYYVEIFKNNPSQEPYWFKSDEISLKSNPTQFDFKIKDYNFDGINDFYIQYSVNNGHSLSKGYLLTINEKGRIVLHTEAEMLGSMNPNKETNRIHSEEVVYCEGKSNKDICKLIHFWENDKLILEERICPC